ncbi:Queuosine Biosynthesis QueE Radical SAM [gamma proteobacterium IMCC2047]|nr:Queuosine Biosynthesis QueE Radical SAM [gamma proteobacterium IMCC2047]
MSLDAILGEVDKYASRHVTVTGGEPLAQPKVLKLLAELCDRDYQVSLETSGAVTLEGVDQRVVKVMDLKTPASQECHRNLYENIDLLNTHDQVKFVICDRQDYDWAKMQIDQYSLTERVDEVLFSPSHGELTGAQLAEWILDDGLQVRFQLQLHKYLWNDEPGH